MVVGCAGKSIEVFDGVFMDDGLGAAAGGDVSVFDEEEGLAAFKGDVDVVEGEDDGHAFFLCKPA